MNAAVVERLDVEASTRPQETVARLQRAMEAGVPVLIPGAYEIRAPQPSHPGFPPRERAVS